MLLAGLPEKPNLPFSDSLVPAGTGDLENHGSAYYAVESCRKPTTNGAVEV